MVAEMWIDLERPAPAVSGTSVFGKLEQVVAWRAAAEPAPASLQAVHTLLEGLGEDPVREGLRDTPTRVVRMLRELTSGYEIDLDSIINGALFHEPYDEVISVRDITFYSLCEHHMLPFYGRVHVAYLPDGKLVGLSKIPRIVETFARRLQVQERLTAQIADFIESRLQPCGVIVAAEAVHMCMVMRGVNQPGGSMRTEARRGIFRQQPELLGDWFKSENGQPLNRELMARG
jgi:GTP cyclohydrolase I